MAAAKKVKSPRASGPKRPAERVPLFNKINCTLALFGQDAGGRAAGAVRSSRTWRRRTWSSPTPVA